MRILIVDDNETNLKVLRAGLRAEGVEVVEAANGIEALEALEISENERKPIDGIVSDILMPRMDGYQLCQRIRSSEKFAGLPFLIYTMTYLSAGDEDLSLRIGADAFLKKPSPAPEIVRALHDALERKGRPQPPVVFTEKEVLKEYNEKLIRKLEEKNAELLESDERFRQIAENIRDVFWLCDPDLAQVFYVSPAYEEIWERTCQSLYENPRSYWEAILPEDRDRVLISLKSCSSSGGFTEEYRIVRPDGSVHWIRDQGFPVRDASGKTIRVAGIAEDITAQKKAEEELARSQEQLRQSQKMEAIGRLSAGIAHDFNNLLTAISGYGEMIVQSAKGEARLQGFAREILQASERAARLTQQLLAFSRKQDRRLQALDLNALISQLEDMLRRLIGDSVTLRHRLSPGLGAVRADPMQIEQVILNLLINARDAMPRGGSIVIETAEAPPKVRLSVVDDGCGMDEKTRKRIFEPFFTTKELGKGTGLGLSVVYGIVEQNGGTIEVSSRPGKGSRFDIYLPCAR